LEDQLKNDIRKSMTVKPDPVLAASRAFLKRFGENCGTRLQEILPEIGLQLHYRKATSYEGALLRMKGIPRGYIVLSSEVQAVRRSTLPSARNRPLPSA